METSSLCRNFLESNGIHAIPQAAGWWTVREYVAELRVAGVADGFYSFQKGRSVKTIGKCTGWANEGQPVPDSNFSEASKRTVSRQRQE